VVISPFALYCSKDVFVDFLSFSIELLVGFIAFVVFLYCIGILASVYFSSAGSTGALAFYWTRFASWCAVFLEPVTTFLCSTCFLVPSSSSA
jgi:hypothetical protein